MPKRNCHAGGTRMPISHYRNEGDVVPSKMPRTDQCGAGKWCCEEKMPGRPYHSEEDMMPKRSYEPQEDMMPKRYWDCQEMTPKHDWACPDDEKNDFCQLVEEAIVDEIGAVSMYAAMANMVDDPLLKALILNVAGDEYGHAKFWLAVLALSDC